MKKLLFIILFTTLMLYSCFFPQITLEASKTGICIWFEQILPALLPFTILSSILIKSNFLQSFSKHGNKIAILLTIICGFIFGFPIGAKLSADFYKSELLSEKQAMILAVLCNNFSPMYVLGYVLPTLFTNTQFHNFTIIFIYGISLILIIVLLLEAKYYQTQHYKSVSTDSNKQYLSKFQSTEIGSNKNFYHSSNSLSQKETKFHQEKFDGFTTYRYERADRQIKNAKTSSSFHLDMNIMDAGIISGFESLIRICGYIVLFSIIATMWNRLWNPAPFAWNWILSNLEITNGIYLLSQSNISDSIKYIAMIQVLSFGGLSGIAQTASILDTTNTSEKKLSVYKYIIGKVILSLLLTLFSIIYVFYNKSLFS